MFTTVCPVCNNKFYCESNHFKSNSSLHRYCVKKRKSKEQKKKNLVRTSTPVPEIENSPASSFSDSVTDFFYQSWKNGLHSSDSTTEQMAYNQHIHQLPTSLPPMYYSPQVIYINTVIYQGFTCSYTPQVGYRADGTYGLLPPYWNYYGN